MALKNLGVVWYPGKPGKGGKGLRGFFIFEIEMKQKTEGRVLGTHTGSA